MNDASRESSGGAHLTVLRGLSLCVLLLGIPAGWLRAQGSTVEVRGLTEPYRTISVAASESGVIAELHVREGQSVRKGEPLATLDSQLLAALLDIARQDMEARGRLEAAQAEAQLREDRARSFASVFESGYARPEELRRAETELAIARANVRAAEEELIMKKLEYEKIDMQIARRRVVAPIDGVISQIDKDEGEYLAPNDPVVLTIVQLNPLLAVFSLTTEQVEHLELGQEVHVDIAGSQQPATATVDFISPVADAESGTVLVKLRVDNSTSANRSGLRCTLQLPLGRQSMPESSAANHGP